VTEPPSRVHPSREDPVVAALSPVVGGPLGDHATHVSSRHRWWSPLRVVLAVTTLALVLGMAGQVPCQRDAWSVGASSARAQHARLCASTIADSYLDAGFAELAWPFTTDAQVRRRHEAPDLPVLVAVWGWGAARVTHLLSGSPDLDARAQRPLEEVATSDAVRREVRTFMAVNAVGLAVLALLAAALLVAAAGRRGPPRRPWDAAAFAASPLLVLTWLTGWTVLPAAALAAALAAAAARRWLAVGVLLGVGLLAWLPVDGLGDPGLGSLWLVAEQATGRSWASSTVLVASGAALAAWLVGVAVLARVRELSPAGLVLLALVGVLLVSPLAPPAWSLLLLPAAALAVPRWSDLLVWQVGELVALLLTGLYLGEYLAPSGGGPATAYWVAVLVRVLAQLWLVGAVLRGALAVPRRRPPVS
jgi:hypothetical protein